MKDGVTIYISGESMIPSEIYDDIIEILSRTPSVEDVVLSASDADISLFVCPGSGWDGKIWAGRSMVYSDSDISASHNNIDPPVGDGDLVVVGNILVFFPAELQRMRADFSEDVVIDYAVTELYQLLVQLLYSASASGSAAYEEAMSLFEQIKKELLILRN